jgi:hypothetical protein
MGGTQVVYSGIFPSTGVSETRQMGGDNAKLMMIFT